MVIALLFSFAYDNPVYPYNKLLYRYDIIRCFKSCARSIHLTDLRPFPMMYVFVPWSVIGDGLQPSILITRGLSFDTLGKIVSDDWAILKYNDLWVTSKAQKCKTKMSSANCKQKCSHLPSVWPDWAINWTLGKFLKPLATIILPKSTHIVRQFL